MTDMYRLFSRIVSLNTCIKMMVTNIIIEHTRMVYLGGICEYNNVAFSGRSPHSALKIRLCAHIEAFYSVLECPHLNKSL